MSDNVVVPAKNARASTGSQAVKKAVSFKNDAAKIFRKTSNIIADKLTSTVNRKKPILVRTGSFSDGVKLDKITRKNEAEVLEKKLNKVLQSLRYIQAVVDKGIPQLLTLSVTDLLEVIMDLFHALASETLQRERVEVNVSLVKLVRWADRVEWSNEEELPPDRSEAMEAISANREAVKKLVTLAVEAIKVRNHSAATAPADATCKKSSTSDIMPQHDALGLCSSFSHSADNILNEQLYQHGRTTGREGAPVKPPLPGQLDENILWKCRSLPMRTHQNSEDPPPLPIKQRNTIVFIDDRPLANGASNRQIATNRHLSSLLHQSSSSICSANSTSSEEQPCDSPPPKPPRKSSQDVIDERRLSEYDNVYEPAPSETNILRDLLKEVQDDEIAEVKPPSASPIGFRSALQVFETRQQSRQSADFDAEKSKFNYGQVVTSVGHTPMPFCNDTALGRADGEVVLQGNHSECGVKESGDTNCETAERLPPVPPKRRNVDAYMHICRQPPMNDASEPSSNISSRRNISRHSIAFYSGQWTQHQAEIFDLTLRFGDSINRNSRLHEELGRSSVEDSAVPPLPPKQSQALEFIVESPNAQISSNLENCNGISPSMISTNPSEEQDISISSALHSLEEEKYSTLDQLDINDRLIYKKDAEDGEGEIQGGTVDELIVHATTAPRRVLLMYQEAFLSTYRTFIAPSALIAKLLYRYSRFSTSSDPRKNKLSRNAFSLLMRVADELCTETGEGILQILFGLVHQLLEDGELMLARTMRRKVLEKCAHLRAQREASKPLLSSFQFSSKSHSITEFRPETIAEQMTLLDAELFQKIEMPEVLLWSREQSEEQSPNLTRFTQHFNKMSYWCQTRILEQEEHRDREKHLTRFIQILKHLRRLNNFNSYLSILSALVSSPVRRLEWQKQNIEALEELEELIDSSASFRNYRQALSETQPPCIPYIGLVLQDLTFVHIGNPDKFSDSRVNFSKCWQHFTILDNVRRFRKCNYGFQKNEKIVAFFNNFDNYLCEEALWQTSEMIKPRPTKKNSLVTETSSNS